jgi:hypothetical protein
VIVALWLLPIAAVVALKVADAAPAATVTDPGTASVALVLVRVTVAPPVGAVRVRVTVQLLEELGPRVAGLHTSEETSTGAWSAKETEKELEPKLALTVADWDVVRLAAVAANVAVEAPAATETVAGAERAAALLLVRVTVAPPDGAAWFKLTVHVEDAREANVVGEQARLVSRTEENVVAAVLADGAETFPAAS